MSRNFYSKFAKRFLDIFFSGIFLIIFSPLFLVVSIIVFFNLGRPILFKQRRPGKDGKIFVIKKFRSMRDEFDKEGKALSDDVRLTKFGKFLRRTSIDELPELLNIFKGEMSFIGPRPLLEEYLPLYSVEQQRRHNVRPGLTGLAQVSGRNLLTWGEKFKIDIEYVDSLSFFNDLKIFFKTIKVVVKREGISPYASEVVEAFNGKN